MTRIGAPAGATNTREGGFTYLEVLIAATLLAVSLLAMCSVFVAAFANVASSGRSTIANAAAHQVLEDIRALPFDNIAALDNFDTDNATSQPASDPEREIARKWRYTLAGDGTGWSFTSAEATRWTTPAGSGGQVRGIGTIDVTAQSTNLTMVTITVNVPGRWRPIVVSTLVARLL
jgi:Tfp pilus assembly protein PilV